MGAIVCVCREQYRLAEKIFCLRTFVNGKYEQIAENHMASRPTCSANTNAMSYERRIGYYELFNLEERLCDKWYPEDLEAAPLTHLNLAFVNFDSNYELIDNQGELISRAAFLKARYSGLRVNIAVGGWTFNDPPTQFYL